MEFSDNIIREDLDTVFVLRTEPEMQASKEYNSNIWDLERENFLTRGQNIYSVPVRALKIGESIYTKHGKFVAYRTN